MLKKLKGKDNPMSWMIRILLGVRSAAIWRAMLGNISFILLAQVPLTWIPNKLIRYLEYPFRTMQIFAGISWGYQSFRKTQGWETCGNFIGFLSS